MRILAIDPGPVESAYVIIDGANRRPLHHGKIPNPQILELLWKNDDNRYDADRIVIEMIASYGMAVGAEVFNTCVWIGRYQQVANTMVDADHVALVKRHPVKLHHCHTAQAKDSNITQALVDRFATGQPNHGKGTKAKPGWFHGFSRDIWQAYALAVYAADTAPDLFGVDP